MASIPLMDCSADEFRADIKGARRTRRRLKILKDDFNACQKAARTQEIYLSRPSHIMAEPTALGWRWESGGWTFIGLAEDELADLPYYVITLHDMLGVPDYDNGHQTSHRSFIDALDTVQWQLGRGILARRR